MGERECKILIYSAWGVSTPEFLSIANFLTRIFFLKIFIIYSPLATGYQNQLQKSDKENKVARDKRKRRKKTPHKYRYVDLYQ